MPFSSHGENVELATVHAPPASPGSADASPVLTAMPLSDDRRVLSYWSTEKFVHNSSRLVPSLLLIGRSTTSSLPGPD